MANAPGQWLPSQPAAGPTFGSIQVRPALEGVGHVLLALFIVFSCFTFLKPSPYDFTAIPTMLLWLMLGIRLYRGALPLVALILAFHLCLLAALVPYLDESNPADWTFQSFYLMVTAIFFVMFFADDTPRRVELGLKAYVASCLFAAVAGIMSYFDTLGTETLFKMDGRAAGVFEDPNVLGSFLILGALYLVHNLLTGRARSVLLSLLGLLIILGGIFLSFSRGSWAAMVIGMVVMIAMAFRSSHSRAFRRRIVILATATVMVISALVAGLLTVEGISERFQDRATVTKDYDEGETGRFGNQRRGMAMLIEKPAGFGPLRWRLTFGLEPHNSYIGGFANGGWLGGFAFIALVLATSFVGFRLCLTPSPFQRQAQIAWPALFMFFLQAFQIDVDHWRHVYMLLGMVWGLEAARVNWLATTRNATRSFNRGVQLAEPSHP
jgi:hypothetical protein